MSENTALDLFAKNLAEQPKTPLKLVETPTTGNPAGLDAIHALFGDKRHTAAFVYDTQLNEPQKMALCMVAKLPRSSLTKSFADIASEHRQQLQRALLEMMAMVSLFETANAIGPEKFKV